MSILWSPAAAAGDLRHVHDAIGARSPAAAAQLGAAILGAIGRLPENPAAGRPDRLPDTRELVITGTPLFACRAP